jgi:hypothetical protein
MSVAAKDDWTPRASAGVDAATTTPASFSEMREATDVAFRLLRS